MAVITLTTDFGWRDNFVGVMKGVILGICPQASIVDLAHDLPPHEVGPAAFSLHSAYTFFPPGTIHVAVVDPGVGSTRAVLGIRTPDYIFIAPDNGLLSYILDGIQEYEARQVKNPALMRPSVSRTFHGRDVMAPAAAHLASGIPFEELGPPADEILRLPPLASAHTPDGLAGRVVYVDRFGNLITNIRVKDLAGWSGITLTLTAGPVTVAGLSESYSAVEPGCYLAVIGSSGFLEIARNQARAEDPPGLTLNTTVKITGFQRELNTER